MSVNIKSVATLPFNVYDRAATRVFLTTLVSKLPQKPSLLALLSNPTDMLTYLKFRFGDPFVKPDARFVAEYVLMFKSIECRISLSSHRAVIRVASPICNSDILAFAKELAREIWVRGGCITIAGNTKYKIHRIPKKSLSLSKPHPSKESLEKLFTYDASTGKLYWKISVDNGKTKMNTEAGCKVNGYIVVMIRYESYYAHRLIWILINGSIDNNLMIDHIDRDRSNNRINNLRLVGASGNVRNSSRHKNNTSGVVGVAWSKNEHRWIAYIRVANKRKHLGYFYTIEDAAAARKDAELRYWATMDGEETCLSAKEVTPLLPAIECTKPQLDLFYFD